MDAFPEPPGGRSNRHVEITGGGHILESELRGRDDVYCLADVMRRYVESLHVHDASISASMPGKWWDGPLRWFRVERCPNLEDSLFHLDVWGFRKARGRLGSLRHLRLRSCPRLQYVLPLRSRAYNALGNLETIHVVRCGDLRHVFVLSEGDKDDDIASKGMEFPVLTTIHLHDLLRAARALATLPEEAPPQALRPQVKKKNVHLIDPFTSCGEMYVLKYDSNYG
ncbi:hypothetical protein PR202_ga14032 [Eleusine coracana subsp. coracana]|uniref:Uncharacterized protein n=1 Tax=Eleusine coracana subsp. coracana TaxID=191504 RepID=A0AAV5CFR1_ELECO|nr:hypothetical protein PR202_ga14032 [Eleusine coracana subsp. coracana]